MYIERIGISRRSEFCTARLAVIEVMPAPDGLPLVVVVDRGESPQQLMASVAARLGYSDPADYEGQPFDEVVARVDRLFRERDLQPIATPDGERECFVSRQAVGGICGPTILSRLLSLTSWQPGQPDPAPDTLRPDTRVSAVAEEPLDDEAPEGPRQVREDVGEPRVVIPMDREDAPAMVSRRVQRAGRNHQFLEARPLIPESLGALQTARYLGKDSNDLYPPLGGALSDLFSYSAARQEREAADHYVDWSAHVSRQEVCGVITAVAREIAGRHDDSEVHGDIKPGNILMTADGPACIDSLRLTPGELSPAMTPGWAAPEQVLNQPASQATDQYPVGVMLCRLLGGVIYGEEVTLVVPTGGTDTERFTTFKNPGVFLDRQTAPVPAQGAAAWQRVLARCLAFEPEQRFPSMTALVSELEEVSEKYPLQDELSLSLSFGSLALADINEEPRLVWVVQESAPGTAGMD